MDCYLHEGIKVMYRVAMAILQLFYKHSVAQNSHWNQQMQSQGVDVTLMTFCKQIPVMIVSLAPFMEGCWWY